MKAHTDIVPRPPMVEEGLPQSLEANELLTNKRLTKNRYQDLINIKRNRSESDSRNIKMFFFLGLSLSLLLVSTAINWKTYERGDLVDLGMIDTEFDDLIEVPVSEQPPPPPPAEKQPLVITEVSDEEIIEDIEINLDVEMTEETELEELNMDFTAEPPAEEVVEEVFTVVEQWPTPEGGMQAFYDYVANEMEYPAAARRLGIEGMVFVRFVVEKDGSITDVTIVRGIGAGCDEEALRVVKNAPSWNPGKQRGRAVRVLMTVPIRFVLKQR
jgi:protein TonB